MERAGEAAAEMDDPGADPTALRLMARETRGKAGSIDDADQVLAGMLLEPEHYEEKVSLTLWNLPLTAALLILVVCVDCFVRKRNGMV